MIKNFFKFIIRCNKILKAPLFLISNLVAHCPRHCPALQGFCKERKNRRMSSVTLKDVRDARERIKDSIHYTPVLTSTYLNTLSGHSLYFKCENMQKTGSFKVERYLYLLPPFTSLFSSFPSLLMQWSPSLF